MKWISKIVTGLIVLTLVTVKMLSPHETLWAEIIIDLLLVVTLLGSWEQLTTYGWVRLTRIISNPNAIVKTKN